jgi:hypothetical protein
MNTAERAISIINGCKNNQQLEVATLFIELMLKAKQPILTKEERASILLAIDKKLTELLTPLTNTNL